MGGRAGACQRFETALTERPLFSGPSDARRRKNSPWLCRARQTLHLASR
jgi:hypothetical protein